MDQNIVSTSRVIWGDELKFGALSVSVDEVISSLRPLLTENRLSRLDEVVSERSVHMVSVMENIYDRGNVSAVMRSAEAFGFLSMYLIDQPEARFKAANRVTKGAEKWLDVREYSECRSAVRDLKAKGYQIWATDLNTMDSIDSLDWQRPIAIVLGNEKDGVSEEMKSLCDGTFRIPMVGFSQSFNISVAGALIYYRAFLEGKRISDAKFKLSEVEKRQLLANYYLRCFDNPEAILTSKRDSTRVHS